MDHQKPTPQAADLWENDPYMKVRTSSPNLSFKEALIDIREKHPLAKEWALNFSAEQSNELLDKLAVLSQDELAEFTDRLAPRDLALVLNCFTVPLYPEEIKLLEAILRRRASWYVYRLAWSFFQKHFPNASLQRTLQTIYQELISDPWLHPRPFDLEETLLDRISVTADDPQLIMACLHLLNHEMRQNPNFTLQNFLDQFEIEPTSAFGVAFLGDFYTFSDPSWFMHDKDLFASVISRMHPSQAAKLIRQGLEADLPAHLMQEFKRLIAKIFVQEQPGSEVWTYLSPELQERFRTWHHNDIIRRHTANAPSKRRVYFHFFDEIKDVATLNSQILALRFTGFIILDDMNQPDFSLYYDDQTVAELLMQGIAEEALLDPPMGGKTAFDAMTLGRKKGIVELRFEEKELPNTLSFLNFALGRTDRPMKLEDTSRLSTWFL